LVLSVFIYALKGLEGLGVNDCRWQSEPTTAPPAGGQVLSLRPKSRKHLLVLSIFYF